MVLSDFTAVEPQKPIPQEHLLNYLAWLMASARCAATSVTSAGEAERVLEQVQARMRRYAVGPEWIERRQFNAFPSSEAGLGSAGGRPELPPGFEAISAEPAGPPLEVRMRRYDELALEVFRRLYARTTEAPDDLIHVTCSGYSSPSPAQRLLVEKGWYSSRALHSYHMGCYGAFPAIRSAVALLAPSVLALPRRKSARSTSSIRST